VVFWWWREVSGQIFATRLSEPAARLLPQIEQQGLVCDSRRLAGSGWLIFEVLQLAFLWALQLVFLQVLRLVLERVWRQVFCLPLLFSLLETASSGAFVQSTFPNPRKLQQGHTQKFRLQSRAL
jgi:hypothetical protein